MRKARITKVLTDKRGRHIGYNIALEGETEIKYIEKSALYRSSIEITNGTRRQEDNIKVNDYVPRERKSSSEIRSRVVELVDKGNKNDNKVYVLHGSDGGIQGEIDCKRSNGTTDFGDGFYLGELLKQAETRASQGIQPMVYCYELDLSKVSVYKLEDGIEWLLFTGYCRGYLKDKIKKYPKIHKKFKEILKYDVIYGRIADDRMTATLTQFLQGLISDRATLYSITAVRYGNQYAIKNNSAVKKCMRLMYMYELDGKDLTSARKQDINYRQDIKRKVENCIRTYNKSGHLIDECLKEYNDRL